MSKSVYMEATLNILAQKDLEATKELMSRGTVSKTETVNYLIIEDEQKI
jgi:hypothetical protein